VSRLDRLARSTLHLCTIADTLQCKNVALQVIDQNFAQSIMIAFRLKLANMPTSATIAL
jgi:DNA invertase Pin-like site-specific DNA recombinase